MFFFRRDAPDDPVEYDGERSVVEIIKFLSLHRSRSLLERKALERAARQAAAAAVGEGAGGGRGEKMAADQVRDGAGAGARAGAEAGASDAALRKLTALEP